LGHVCSGLFGNNDDLSRELLSAGTESGDRAWQLPLWGDYQEGVKSNFADFANIGGGPRGGGGAGPLPSGINPPKHQCPPSYHWAHLDLAGIALKSGREKGATGRPVPLLATFLMKRAKG